MIWFSFLFIQDALKSPEVKKKIQHITWPWALPQLWQLRLIISFNSHDYSFPNKRCDERLSGLHHDPLLIFLFMVDSQHGRATLSRSILLVEVTSFLVAFCNLKCPSCPHIQHLPSGVVLMIRLTVNGFMYLMKMWGFFRSINNPEESKHFDGDGHIHTRVKQTGYLDHHIVEVVRTVKMFLTSVIR